MVGSRVCWGSRGWWGLRGGGDQCGGGKGVLEVQGYWGGWVGSRNGGV